MSKPIIEIQNISKRYKLGANKGSYLSLRDEIVNWISPTQRRARAKAGTFWALDDVSFSINQGEVVGIIGRNGAGKSTLLKVLSKITPPTSGQIIRRGRVASLLEVGTGFHPELTGRDNIYLNGAILGMSRKEITAKFDEIVAFSEVEKFLDTPVKRYSSGMYVRLAFAVAAHLEPEVLVVDEVLAVGDAEFQKKCLGKMDNVAKGGRTVILVSHNLSVISQLCNTCVLLKQGKVDYFGPVDEALAHYCERLASQSGEVYLRSNSEGPDEQHKEGAICRVYLTQQNNTISDTFFIGESMTINMDLKFYNEIPKFQMSFVVQTSMGIGIYHCASTDVTTTLGEGKGEVTVSATFPHLMLYPGNYTIDELWLATADGQKIDYVRNCIGFHVPEGGPNVNRALAKSVAVVLELPKWECKGG